MTKWQEYRKAAVAVAGVAAQLINSGVLHGSAQLYGSALLALLTATGVYVVPNDGRTPPVP